MKIEIFIKQNTANCGQHEITRMARDIAHAYRHRHGPISTRQVEKALRRHFGSRRQAEFEVIPMALSL